jgi:hypothetical protein
VSEKDQTPSQSDLADRLGSIAAVADCWDPAQNLASMELGAASGHLVVGPGYVPVLPAGDMRELVRELLQELEAFPAEHAWRYPVGAVLAHVRTAARILDAR